MGKGIQTILPGPWVANSCPKRDYWGWRRAWRKVRGQVHLGVFIAACAPPSPLSTGLVPWGKGHLGCLGRCGLHPTVPAVFVLRCRPCVPLCADLGRWLVDRRKGSFRPLLSPSPLGASSLSGEEGLARVGDCYTGEHL